MSSTGHIKIPALLGNLHAITNCVTAAASGAGDFRIEIRDSGKEFGMTKLPDPDLPLGISERPISGLRAYLIKKKADAVSYRRLSSFNVLTLIFNFPSSTSSKEFRA